MGFSDDCVGVITIQHKRIFCAFSVCHWETSSLVCTTLPWCVRYFYDCERQVSDLSSFFIAVSDFFTAYFFSLGIGVLFLWQQYYEDIFTSCTVSPGHDFKYPF